MVLSVLHYWTSATEGKSLHTQVLYTCIPQVPSVAGRISLIALHCLSSAFSLIMWFHFNRWWKTWKQICTARCKALLSVSMPPKKQRLSQAGDQTLICEIWWCGVQGTVTWELKNSVSSKLGAGFARQRDVWTVVQGYVNWNTPWWWQHWDFAMAENQPPSFCKTKLEIWRGSWDFAFWQHFFSSDTISAWVNGTSWCLCCE